MSNIKEKFAALMTATTLATQSSNAQTFVNTIPESETMNPNTFTYSADTSINGITANLTFMLTGDVTTPDVENRGTEQFRNDVTVVIELLNTNGDRDYISEFTSVTGNLSTFTDLGINSGDFSFSFVDDTFLTNDPDLVGESGRDSFRRFSIAANNLDLGGLSNTQQFSAVFGGLDQLTVTENNFAIGGDLWATLPGNDDQYITFENLTPVSVPEPTSTALLGLGAVAAFRRKRTLEL